MSGDNPLPASFAAKAAEQGLRTATTQTFPTMARAPEEKGGAGRLVYLKAVSDTYPLRGVLRVRVASSTEAASQTVHAATNDAGNGVSDVAITQPPQPGEVWVEAPLLETLGLQVGDTLWLGNSALRIAHVLTQEPDRGGGLISFAPRVLMHETDLPATELIQPASRVNYRLALVGAPGAVRSYTDWARAEIAQPGSQGVRLQSLEEDSPRMQETLGRASNFLNLVALLTALLSAVAIVLGTRSFAARHLDGCAMMRVFGLPQRTIALVYGTEFLLAGLAGSLCGVALGYGVHYGFVALLAHVLRVGDLPQPGVQPALIGLGVGMTLLLAFGLPPVLQMADTPALRVIRRELGGSSPHRRWLFWRGWQGLWCCCWRPVLI